MGAKLRGQHLFIVTEKGVVLPKANAVQIRHARPVGYNKSFKFITSHRKKSGINIKSLCGPPPAGGHGPWRAEASVGMLEGKQLGGSNLAVIKPTGRRQKMLQILFSIFRAVKLWEGQPTNPMASMHPSIQDPTII
jgi:hypothetical protein